MSRCDNNNIKIMIALKCFFLISYYIFLTILLYNTIIVSKQIVCIVVFPDPDVDIAALEIPITVIATVVKNFFNDLSEALIPSSLYEELVKAVGM
jgi:hypothetical protein